MEALLIINSILVAICLYFIKDFHGDFKEVAKKVQGLKEKINEMDLKFQALAIKLNGHIKNVKKRFSRFGKTNKK